MCRRPGLRRWWKIHLPSEADKPSPARRAFLTGEYFTRQGRAQLALEFAAREEAAPGSVSLDTGSCLGWQRMTCLGCRDACPEDAISMVTNLQPRIDQQRCTGCGECAVVCPANSIHISMLANH